MSRPLYQTIQEDLFAKIQNGEYLEDEIIPTELELAALYGVSRPTVRQAVQSLVDEGYLEKRKKRGTIVKKPKIQQEFTHVIESFDSEMKKKGIAPKTKILKFTEIPATEEVAESLALAVGDTVYKLTRLRFAEDKPVVLVTSYIPFDLFPELRDVDFSQRLLYTTFEEMGHPIQAVTRKLEVIKADETASDLLDVAIDEPLFYFHTTGYGLNRVPIEYSISKYRGDINYFVFELGK